MPGSLEAPTELFHQARPSAVGVFFWGMAQAFPEISACNASAGMMVRPPTRTAFSGEVGSAKILKIVDLPRLVAWQASRIE